MIVFFCYIALDCFLNSIPYRKVFIFSPLMEKLIIIWSWPAGHTAAIYAGRALLEPLMFEGFMANGFAAWGQLTTTTDVENFPGFPDGIMGPELMERMRAQSLHSGCRIETKTVDSVNLDSDGTRGYHEVVLGSTTYQTKTLIISTGASAKRLWLSGEETYRQNGVSACAVCDGALPMFRNKPLIVIGGWDAAVEEAVYLTKFASKVTMLIRSDVLKASKAMQQRAFANEKIEILRNTQWVEILGDGRFMSGLRVINNQTQETTDLEAWGLFYAIGHEPATKFLNGQLELDAAGYIITKGHMSTATSVPGVFAAWDVQDHVYRQAITSAWTGCMAALEAERWLEEHK